jgi:hypothetical protein
VNRLTETKGHFWNRPKTCQFRNSAAILGLFEPPPRDGSTNSNARIGCGKCDTRTSNSSGLKNIHTTSSNIYIQSTRSIGCLKANSIGGGQAVMKSNFGTLTDAQAQALSDRLAGLLAWWNGAESWMTTADQVRQALKDLVDATTVAT